jgi:hypothetical protein
MTMLAAIQHFCRRSGIPRPTTVYGSTDSQVLQVMALLEEEGNDLSLRNDWQALTFEASHTSLATEDQGAIATIASNGFRHIKNETIWNRSTQIPLYGPMDAAEWQAVKGITSTGPHYQYRIRGGRLIVNPTPTAGDSWYFEYVSKNWILGADGVTYKQYFTLDTDTFLLPEELLMMGLRWRWKKEKGLDYAEDFRTYETQVNDIIGRDGGKKRLRMDTASPDVGPKVFVAAGNWAIP